MLSRVISSFKFTAAPTNKYSWEADALLCSLFKSHTAGWGLLWLLRKLLKQETSDAFVDKHATFDAKTQQGDASLTQAEEANKQ